MAGPGEGIPGAAAGRGGFRASHADRDGVIDLLQAAFVQGRLTKDELDLRIGQTFAARTYAELARLTVDIPVALIAASGPHHAARARTRPPMNNAAKSGISVAIAVVTLVLAAYVTDGQALFMFVPLYSAALVVALAQMLDSRHQKRSRRQLPPRPAQ